MKRTLLAVTLCTLAACGRTVQVESGGDVALGNVTPVNSSVLPAGAQFDVALAQTISASNTRVGDSFTARVTDNVIAQDGSVAVPAGAVVSGRVTGIEGASDPTKAGLIRLDFQTLAFNGRSYPFNATVERTAIAGRSNEDLMKAAGTGAAVGAVLGAVIGRDVKDAVIGGAIGAAAGSLISLGTNAADARLPEGTRLTLRSTQRVALWR